MNHSPQPPYLCFDEFEAMIKKIVLQGAPNYDRFSDDEIHEWWQTNPTKEYAAEIAVMLVDDHKSDLEDLWAGE